MQTKNESVDVSKAEGKYIAKRNINSKNVVNIKVVSYIVGIFVLRTQLTAV